MGTLRPRALSFPKTISWYFASNLNSWNSCCIYRIRTIMFLYESPSIQDMEPLNTFKLDEQSLTAGVTKSFLIQHFEARRSFNWNFTFFSPSSFNEYHMEKDLNSNKKKTCRLIKECISTMRRHWIKILEFPLHGNKTPYYVHLACGYSKYTSRQNK